MLIFSAVHFAGLLGGIKLPDLPLTVPRSYLLVKNGFWMVISVIASFTLFTGRRWAVQFTRGSALLFALWYWVDRTFIMHSEFTRQSWPIAAFITGALLLVLLGITSRKSVRDYFQESEE